MSTNAIIKPNGTALANPVVKSGFKKVSESIKSAGNNTKALAITFRDLRDMPELKDEFPGMDFKAIIDKYFGNEYSGNTAYKYAYCVDCFKASLPEIWTAFPMGKLIILTGLYKKGVPSNGVSVPGLFQYLGNKLNMVLVDNMNQWETENAMALQQIEVLKAQNLPYDNIKVTDKPDAPFDVNSPDYASVTTEWGMRVILRKSDAFLKDIIKEYKDFVKGETADDSAEGKADGKAKQNPDKLREKAYAALVAYASTLETVPKEVTAMCEYLKGDAKK